MWRRNRERQPSSLHRQLFVQSLEMAIPADRPKFMPTFWKRLVGSCQGRGSTVQRSTRPRYHCPSLANWQHRSMVRRRLGARSAARRGDQWSRANSPTMRAYSGPTERDLLRRAPIPLVRPYSATGARELQGWIRGRVPLPERQAHCLSRPEESAQFPPVGQEPRLYGSDRNPETHAAGRVGKVPRSRAGPHSSGRDHKAQTRACDEQPH